MSVSIMTYDQIRKVAIHQPDNTMGQEDNSHRFTIEPGRQVILSNVRSSDVFEYGDQLFQYVNGTWYTCRNTVKETPVGYHKRKIEKREFGTAGKIMEEVEEFLDAKEQGIRLMELQELSDILGAVEGYLEKNHEGYTLDDLLKMAKVTRRAFESGRRK